MTTDPPWEMSATERELVSLIFVQARTTELESLATKRYDMRLKWRETSIQLYVDWLNDQGRTWEGELWGLLAYHWGQTFRRLQVLAQTLPSCDWTTSLAGTTQPSALFNWHAGSLELPGFRLSQLTVYWGRSAEWNGVLFHGSVRDERARDQVYGWCGILRIAVGPLPAPP